MNHKLNPHQWVSAHADYLYAFAITRINDEEQAKDLVQETFLAALEKVNSFEGKSDFKK
jgi:DNA-directed RNA polymerase specialized sigma24 family protein